MLALVLLGATSGAAADGPAAKRISYFGKSMPDFELKGSDGRVWRRSDLAGKVAVVSVWATWCEPCRKELPLLQRLYERVRDRKDVVVLAFNVDEKPELVPPFVAANGFTFPVVLAHEFVRVKLATVGIPRLWILDAGGNWRFDEMGYAEGADWEAMVLAKIRSASRPSALAGAPGGH
jgi:thiol-disulfide isomerase/thioredoxin